MTPAGGRASLPTPALVCDLDALEANVAAMAGFARSAGLALRPHAKSHKSSHVARLQLDAGAAGIACAKLGEAEALVGALESAGVDPRSVLLTSPTVGDAAARRVAALARRCALLCCVDAVEGVAELAAAGADVGVVVDVDVGLGRTGVTSARGAVGVARAALDAGLAVAGVQGYGGHLQHIAGRDERRAATAVATARLADAVAALRGSGIRVGLVTGGGTGTAGLDAELGVLTEIQPGSYVFMDREYRDALGDDPEGRFAQSLFVDATVVSANHEGHVTIDAGLKAMATDAGAPAVASPAGAYAYSFFGDEHGLVTQDPAGPLARGDRVALVPPHCDPTVDRYDAMWLVRGDRVVGSAPIEARGRAQ